MGTHQAMNRHLTLLVAAACWPAATARGQTSTSTPTLAPAIVWEPATGTPLAVRVLNPPAATVEALRDAGATDPRWPAILAVHLADAAGAVPADRPALLGAYQVVGPTLRFTPRFPLDAARRYQARFDPDGPLGPAAPVIADRAAAPGPPVVRTVVTRVEPLGPRLPANILRFYLYFSAPMGRGAAYEHLKLIDDAAGQPLDHPFLELGEELWDPTQTRLTVLLDPGRIKRGLRPRAELGPIFVAGRSYTLRIDPAWLDAAGHPLGAPGSRSFATTAEDETAPDPKTWTMNPPRAGATDPLVVRFGDILDRATVASGLILLDPRGAAVAGTAEATADGSGWRFQPDAPWAVGSYELAIETDLEDLAGNSIRRPFEVDIQRDVPVAPPATQVRLMVPIKR